MTSTIGATPCCDDLHDRSRCGVQHPNLRPRGAVSDDDTPSPTTTPSKRPRVRAVPGDPARLPAPALSIRTTATIIERIDALIPWAAGRPDVAPVGRAARSDVARAALAVGLDVLERRVRLARLDDVGEAAWAERRRRSTE